MSEFSSMTGLHPESSTPQRYLWTDAFAVCNFLQLHRKTGEDAYLNLALQLVDQVHHVLGRYREDDPRSGWISGLDALQGEQHPAVGGLRIGKAMPERGPDEPFDENQEWDRDGQYYHYLTKWMHALSRVAKVTGDDRYLRWALELAKTAHARFVHVDPATGKKAIYWKMSTDLSRPLVPSMGQHDPVDGLITCLELQDQRPAGAAAQDFPDLAGEIRDMAGICEGMSWVSADPLGIGGVLFDACRLARILEREPTWLPLLPDLLEAAAIGLQAFARTGALNYPIEYRLAFRELGLSIGLHGIDPIRDALASNRNIAKAKSELSDLLDDLQKFRLLAGVIEQFWLDPKNQGASSWQDHRAINMVMLATSLEPDGFLGS